MATEDKKTVRREASWPLSEGEFSMFQKLLAEECGISFERDRSYALQQALWSRAQAIGCVSYREYYHHLKSGRELRELIDLVTVGETFFFRHQGHFDVLMQVVFPEIIQRRSAADECFIRIWSAGCSRGAEPYSIAIALAETLPTYRHWDISILGTDVDRNALIRAREAVFSSRDVEQMPPEYAARYFDKKGSHYHLKSDIKRMVRFDDHNLAKDAFTREAMQRLDIIFCRNVTIYFDIPTIKKIMDRFYHCLVPEGYLFIGYAETLWQITNQFRTIEFPHTFIYQKPSSAVAAPAAKSPFIGIPEIKVEEIASAGLPALEGPARGGVAPQEPPAPKKTRPASPSPRYKEAAAFFAAKQYDEALSLFNEILAQNAADLQSHFLKATILANQAKYDEAQSELSSIIGADNLFVEAYYLSGVLWYKMGNFKEAETQFKKTIYIDAGIALAHFNLANVYLCQKRPGEATREFNNALILLEKMPLDEIVRFSEDLTAEFLVKICRTHLKRLKKEV